MDFSLKKIKENYLDKKTISETLEDDYRNFTLDFDFKLDDELQKSFNSVTSSFEKLSHSEKKWSVTLERENDRIKERTTASTSISRVTTEIGMSSLDIIKTERPALYFKNANGGDIYLYPGFLIIKKSESDDFAVIDLKSVRLDYEDLLFIEDESVPKDSELTGYTWLYANKDGSEDKRRKDNYQIPVLRYGDLRFLSNEGLNEAFLFSNSVSTREFYKCLHIYIRVLNKINWE